MMGYTMACPFPTETYNYFEMTLVNTVPLRCNVALARKFFLSKMFTRLSNKQV